MESNITYDVRFWKTEVYKGAEVTTYKVRWKTGTKAWKESFRVKAQATSFEAQLRAAASKGEAFDMTTGRPVSWGRKTDDMSWYDFCIAYVDMKWKRAAAHHRSNIAWALATVTPAMFTTTHGKPDGETMRTALRKWGFNTKQRAEVPDESAATLTWLSRNTKPVSALADPAMARALLTAAETLIDGTSAAPSTTRRNRAILHNAMEYAIELRQLGHNPVEAIKWKAPKTTSEVDRRCVVNPSQARKLLDAVQAQEPSGPRLATFYAVMYYAGLRPEEVVSLHRDSVILPPLVQNDETGTWEEPVDAWGELRFATAAPEVGAEWTDDGRRHDHRQLKARAPGECRHVPLAPPLVRLLREHLKNFGNGRAGLVFTGVHGGELASATYRRVWDRARESALTAAEYASPLARRVYDLRHACVSTWLSAGVPPAQVAEWAGHSVAVLLRIYAKCVDGQDQVNKRRIRDILREPKREDGRQSFNSGDGSEHSSGQG
jgi:integrase